MKKVSEIEDEIHTRLTEFEPEDEYTGEGVGLGQDLMGIREYLRTRKEWVISPRVRRRCENFNQRRI